MACLLGFITCMAGSPSLKGRQTRHKCVQGKGASLLQPASASRRRDPALCVHAHSGRGLPAVPPPAADPCGPAPARHRRLLPDHAPRLAAPGRQVRRVRAAAGCHATKPKGMAGHALPALTARALRQAVAAQQSSPPSLDCTRLSWALFPSQAWQACAQARP